jgi:hypothetical protein
MFMPFTLLTKSRLCIKSSYVLVKKLQYSWPRSCENPTYVIPRVRNDNLLRVAVRNLGKRAVHRGPLKQVKEVAS